MQHSEQYFLRLSANDNALVVVKAIQQGQEIELEGVKITARKTIAFGHKVAARALTAGEKIVKFGMPKRHNPRNHLCLERRCVAESPRPEASRHAEG